MSNAAAPPVLDVAGLDVTLFTRAGRLRAVEGLDLRLHAGETLALVGESGCGKSLSALAVMRLLPEPPARITAGSVRLDGRDLVGLPEREMVRLRGAAAAMIFQDPVGSLNPVTTIGKQITEALRAHVPLSAAAAAEQAATLLDLVGVPAARRRLGDYPHQLSGGTCQRVAIAMAIACRPRLLIADEATTALDVTIQAQVLALLRRVQAETGMAMLVITHDLGVVADMAQRVAVMYAGHKVEEAPVDALFAAPLHPYTRGLLGATPTPGSTAELVEIPGRVPSLAERPAGCPFAPRCPLAFARCTVERPRLAIVAPDRQVACFAAAPS